MAKMDEIERILNKEIENYQNINQYQDQVNQVRISLKNQLIEAIENKIDKVEDNNNTLEETVKNLNRKEQGVNVTLKYENPEIIIPQKREEKKSDSIIQVSEYVQTSPKQNVSSISAISFNNDPQSSFGDSISGMINASNKYTSPLKLHENEENNDKVDQIKNKKVNDDEKVVVVPDLIITPRVIEGVIENEIQDRIDIMEQNSKEVKSEILNSPQINSLNILADPVEYLPIVNEFLINPSIDVPKELEDEKLKEIKQDLLKSYSNRRDIVKKYYSLLINKMDTESKHYLSAIQREERILSENKEKSETILERASSKDMTVGRDENDLITSREETINIIEKMVVQVELSSSDNVSTPSYASLSLTSGENCDDKYKESSEENNSQEKTEELKDMDRGSSKDPEKYNSGIDVSEKEDRREISNEVSEEIEEELVFDEILKDEENKLNRDTIEKGKIFDDNRDDKEIEELIIDNKFSFTDDFDSSVESLEVAKPIVKYQIIENVEMTNRSYSEVSEKVAIPVEEEFSLNFETETSGESKDLEHLKGYDKIELIRIEKDEYSIIDENEIPKYDGYSTESEVNDETEATINYSNHRGPSNEIVSVIENNINAKFNEYDRVEVIKQKIDNFSDYDELELIDITNDIFEGYNRVERILNENSAELENIEETNILMDYDKIEIIETEDKNLTNTSTEVEEINNANRNFSSYDRIENIQNADNFLDYNIIEHIELQKIENSFMFYDIVEEMERTNDKSDDLNPSLALYMSNISCKSAEYNSMSFYEYDKLEVVEGDVFCDYDKTETVLSENNDLFENYDRIEDILLPKVCDLYFLGRFSSNSRNK